MLLKANKLSFLALFLTFSSLCSAAVVAQVKNEKVLIDSQQDQLNIGDEFYLLNSDEKKTGLIRITSVKEGKAVATLIKGTAQGGETLAAYSTQSLSTSEQPQDTASTATYRLTSRKLSLLVGLINNTMVARESDGVPPKPNFDDATMTGSTIGVLGAFDYPLNNWFEMRLTAGYEPFTVAGSTSINGCDNATTRDCSTDISYLSLGAFARFDLYKSKSLVWLGLGGTVRFPIAKKSTALRNDDINISSSYGVSAGVDFFLTHKMYIPLSLDQQFILGSDTVKANFLALRAGIGLAY